MKINHFEQYEQVIKLENALGSPRDQGNLFSFAEVVRLDEQSEFPAKQAELLTRLNVSHHYVPVALGGRLGSFEEFVGIFRTVYRRDPTLGLGYGATTFMAAIHTFLVGTDALKKRVADIVLSGQPISVAYHEKNHGNDLLGNELTAIQLDNGHYRLQGKKWVVNNIAVSKGLTVFAKTSEKAGGRGFSLFFVDKEAVDTTTLVYLPKIKTHGVKGCRIAGVELGHTEVPASAVIGQIGEGVELTFKAFQITRATLPGMSLGAGDTALRVVLNFANQRILYGQPIIKIPHVYETLVDSFVRLLLCDALSITASRSLHAIPAQMSVIASITKFYIPKAMQKMLKDLAVILGARHYVRDGEYAIFQKIIRDYPVVSVGHSSDVICANTLLPQMKLLLSRDIVSENVADILGQIFTLDQPVKTFEPAYLRISNGGYNDIIKSLDLMKKQIERRMNLTATHQSVKNAVNKALRFIKGRLAELTSQLNLIESSINAFSKATYAFIEAYSEVFVGLSCIWLWVFNDSKISDFFDGGAWLALSLQKIFKQASILELDEYKQLTSDTLDYLQYLSAHNLSFSIIPINYN